MTLFISTIEHNLIEIGIKKHGKFLIKKQFASNHRQAEDLLPAIDKMIKAKELKLSDLKNIEVNNYGGSFTSLRIGVITANALAYALGIGVKGTAGKEKKAGRNGKFKVIEPYYDAEPRITKKLK